MAPLKKGTKLTDNPKDFMLRVRMDEQTLAKLDKISKAFSMSRSESVRKSIDYLEQSIRNGDYVLYANEVAEIMQRQALKGEGSSLSEFGKSLHKSDTGESSKLTEKK